MMWFVRWFNKEVSRFNMKTQERSTFLGNNTLFPLTFSFLPCWPLSDFWWEKFRCWIPCELEVANESVRCWGSLVLLNVTWYRSSQRANVGERLLIFRVDMFKFNTQNN